MTTPNESPRRIWVPPRAAHVAKMASKDLARFNITRVCLDAAKDGTSTVCRAIATDGRMLAVAQWRQEESIPERLRMTLPPKHFGGIKKKRSKKSGMTPMTAVTDCGDTVSVGDISLSENHSPDDHIITVAKHEGAFPNPENVISSTTRVKATETSPENGHVRICVDPVLLCELITALYNSAPKFGRSRVVVLSVPLNPEKPMHAYVPNADQESESPSYGALMPVRVNDAALSGPVMADFSKE